MQCQLIRRNSGVAERINGRPDNAAKLDLLADAGALRDRESRLRSHLRKFLLFCSVISAFRQVGKLYSSRSVTQVFDSQMKRISHSASRRSLSTSQRERVAAIRRMGACFECRTKKRRVCITNVPSIVDF